MAIKIAGTEVINDNRELVLAKLTEINTSIADTAVDIFVYDTRKDSDGGQWRHRCQHTSWYNETLNTATRGSRKEFPSVAVIVAESALGGNVNIYDGDDPDMPLWMTFNNTGVLSWATGSSINLLSVAALNGIVFIGTNAQGGVHIDFNKDYIRLAHSSNSYGLNGDRFILNRNSSGIGYVSGSDGYNLVNYTINDVAMSVLPNAPIDAATGLPVPTIAVATDGGVSVIKDDGNVYDISGNSYGSSAVTFEGEALYAWRRTSGTARGYLFRLNGSVASLTSDLTWPTNGTNSNFTLYVPSVNSVETNQGPTKLIGSGYYTVWDVEGTKDGFAASQLTANILNLVDENESDPDTGSVAYVASSYNTGWMNGDIKLATLSDTDATNVTGSELVTNGTFDTDVSGWTPRAGTTATVVSGRARVSGDGTGSSSIYPYIRQAVTTVVGKTYTVTVDFEKYNSGGDAFLQAGLNGGAELVSVQSSASSGTLTGTFVATGTSTDITIVANIATSTTTGTGQYFDNISVRLAEEDRSVNGNGLQVFGTVTKSAVATGADLVAYSGFSTLANYLEQPYNSDLDFGTGDFCVMGWLKDATITDMALDRRSTSTSAGFYAYIDTDNTIRFATSDSGNNQSQTKSASSVLGSQWKHVCFVRTNSGTLQSVYVDGVLSNADTVTARNVTNTSATLTFGVWAPKDNYAFNGSLALWRISATAPSPEQIKKIYEDEKVLFQENAQATLYGSSDAVTALAYDDSTELLHVGTSAGRSVFQGLRRVDNTTTAVGAAISASNGLVADE